MAFEIGLARGAEERNRQHQEETGVRRDRAWLGGLAAVAWLLLATLAAWGNEPSGTLDLGEKPDVYAYAFSPDGRLLALYNNQAYKDKDKSLTLWDVATKKQVAVLKSDGWYPSSVFCFTADGKSLIANGTSLIVWDVATFKERSRIDRFEKIADTYGPLLFTPDGKWMIWVSSSRGVLVFDMATGKVVKTIQDDGSPIGKVSVMAVSPDGKTLAVGTGMEWAGERRDRKVVRWGGALFLCDLEKGEVRHKIAHAGADDEKASGLYSIDLLAFSPDGKRLVSTGSHRRLAVWNPATGESVDFLRPGFELGDVNALAYSPDGKTLAMANNAVVELWDIDAGGFRDDFWVKPKPNGLITHLAFSPDGKTLVTAGLHIPVDFWDVPAGAPKDVRKDTTPPHPAPPQIIINGRLYLLINGRLSPAPPP